ncbi:MAG: glycosyltransferase family 39 protein [Armatimonadota bacterium]|nr:glycosyltransferase family 39 protein [Armatimonadota bacterium]MCX7777415.1 glycosyltransferase family 39 protein [Armatimonadota bacterium]MDW8025084.1 glycosyltransferase family 39 protein [Armatimonadota bacterium]
MARKIASALLMALLSLIIRCTITITWFNQREKVLAPDSYGYERLAINLIEHRVFSQSSMPPFTLDTHRTPIYPLFIASVYSATDRNPIAVILAQNFIDALNTTFIYAIASSASNQAGIIASLAYAIAPLPIFQCQRMLTETLFVFFILAATLSGLKAITHHRSLAIMTCGLMLGLATLTRPVGIGIWFIWFIALAIAMRRLTLSQWLLAMVKFAVSSLLPIVPWLIRNFIAFKMLFLCTGHHIAFAYYNAASVLSRATGLSLEQAQVRLFNESISDFDGMRPFKAEDAEDIWQPAIQDPRNTMALMRRAKEIVRQHPTETVLVHAEGFMHYLFMTIPIRDVLAKFSGVEGKVFDEPIRERLMRLLNDGKVGTAISLAWNERLKPLPLGAKLLWFYSLIFTLLIEGIALGTIKVYIVRRDIARTICLICIAISLYLLLTPGPQLEPRFRAVAEPWLIMLASIGITGVIERRGKVAIQQSAP